MHMSRHASMYVAGKGEDVEVEAKESHTGPRKWKETAQIAA
jgi:hypothetical protein